MRKSVLALAAGLAVAGCIRTQEMPLAPNVVRIDTQASGLLFTGQTVPQTMRRAAELTLQAGYTHFRIEQATSRQGSQLAGVVSSDNVSGSYGGGSFQASGFGSSNAIYRPTANAGATVIMLKAGDRGLENAFDAVATLKRYSQ